MMNIKTTIPALVLVLLSAISTSSYCLPGDVQADSAAVQYEEVLTGKIGKYAATMHLDPEDFHGYVIYHWSGNKFTLKCTKSEAINLHGSMKVQLKEYYKGKCTGTYDGQYESRGNYFAGTFTDSKGRKSKFEFQ